MIIHIVKIENALMKSILISDITLFRSIGMIVMREILDLDVLFNLFKVNYSNYMGISVCLCLQS